MSTKNPHGQNSPNSPKSANLHDSGKTIDSEKSADKISNAKKDPNHGFYYNIVFTHTILASMEIFDAGAAREGAKKEKETQTAFCSLHLDQKIEYGSDLQSIREFLSKSLGAKDLVIVSWRRMEGAIRPGGAMPHVLGLF